MSERQKDTHGRRSQGDAAPSSVSSTHSPGAAATVPFLIIGRIVAPHGVRGELRVSIETDDPSRFLALDRVYLGDKHVLHRVLGARLHKGQALLRLDGVHDRDEAETLRGVLVHVSAEDALPLGQDEYYQHQILGLDVVTESGEHVGRVREILLTGANDVYVVRGHRGEVLLPAIRETILRVDLENSQMIVRVPEELWP